MKSSCFCLQGSYLLSHPPTCSCHHTWWLQAFIRTMLCGSAGCSLHSARRRLSQTIMWPVSPLELHKPGHSSKMNMSYQIFDHFLISSDSAFSPIGHAFPRSHPTRLKFPGFWLLGDPYQTARYSLRTPSPLGLLLASLAFMFNSNPMVYLPLQVIFKKVLWVGFTSRNDYFEVNLIFKMNIQFIKIRNPQIEFS